MPSARDRRAQRAQGWDDWEENAGEPEWPTATEVDAAIFGTLATTAQAGAQLTKTPDGTWRFRRLEMTSTALLLPDDISESEWAEAGEFISGLAGALAWWLADWMLRAEWTWRYTHEAVAERFGLDVKTLYVYTWCARKYDLEQRVPGASFSHHRIVATLPADNRRAWLEAAARHGWTIAELREQLRHALQPGERSETWTHNDLFDRERMPKLKRAALLRMARAAAAGNKKAQETLAQQLNEIRDWTDEVARAAGIIF